MISKLLNQTVLVVDDQGASSTALILSKAGYRIEHVCGVDEAKHKLHRLGNLELTPDLIISEKLPSEWLEGLLEFIESKSYLNSIGIICIQASNDDKNSLSLPQVDAVLSFPVEPSVLLPLVSALLRVRILSLERDAARSCELKALSDFEEAMIQRNELLSIVSHELKTPISSILLRLQLLQRAAQKSEKTLSAEILKSVEPALSQLLRLTKMIENVLDVSRLDRKKIQLNLEAFDLSQAVHEVVASLIEISKASGSSLVVTDQPSLIGYWDRCRVDQMLLNLLTNAIKYGAGKPIEIKVFGDEHFATVLVKDQGIGIPESDHSRIFKKFERSTSQHRSQSLGLGLYIVREIASAHGGTVDLESKLAEGSTFKLTLPRKTLLSKSNA